MAKDVLEAPNFKAGAVGRSFQATGKTGATATPVMLAGGTASGAPTTGAHVKGEIVVDDTGVFWYCTVAGTPGTWVAPAQLAPGNGTAPNTGTPGSVSIDLLPDIEVDSVKLAGRVVETSARLATTVVLPACTYNNGSSGVGATLTADAVGILTIDLKAVVLGDDVVIKNQVSKFQHGIYTMTTEGTAGVAFVLTRRSNADQAADFAGGIFVRISDGLEYAGVTLTSAPLTVTMGTTAISFRGLIRPMVTPVDVRMGTARDRRRYEADFEELDAAIVVAGGANQRIPGTIFTVRMEGVLSTATQQNESNVVSGAIDLATGTDTNGFCSVSCGMGAVIFDSTREYRFGCRVKTPTVTSAAELFTCKAGLMVSLLSSTAQTAGIYFEIPSTPSSNIIAVVANASTGLAGVDTGIAGGTGYRQLWWQYDPTTGAVTFYTTVNVVPTLIATITTNLPTVALASGAQILKAGGTTGTTSRSLRVDHLAFDIIDNRALHY